VARRRRPARVTETPRTASFECIGPGAFVIRVHRDEDPTRGVLLGLTSLDQAQADGLKRFRDSDWPERAPRPKSLRPDERRAARIAVINRVASSERDRNAMLANEGFTIAEGGAWHPPSADQARINEQRRHDRELRGLARRHTFGGSNV
jgi:hypothetical protein